MKKYFDRPPSTMGDWLVLAAGTALLFAAVARLPAVLMALGGLLGYLYETQKTDLGHLDQLTWYRTGQYMELDLTARRNLELTETLRSTLALGAGDLRHRHGYGRTAGADRGA